MTQYAEGSTSFSLNIDSNGLDSAVSKASKLEETLKSIEKARTISVKVDMEGSARSLKTLKDILAGKNSVLTGAKDTTKAIGSMGDALRSGIKDTKDLEKLQKIQDRYKASIANSTTYQQNADKARIKLESFAENQVATIAKYYQKDIDNLSDAGKANLLARFELINEKDIANLGKKYKLNLSEAFNFKQDLIENLNKISEVEGVSDSDMRLKLYDDDDISSVEEQKKKILQTQKDFQKYLIQNEEKAKQSRKTAASLQKDFFDIYDNSPLEDENNRIRRPETFEVNIVANTDQLSSAIDEVIDKPRTVKVQLEEDGELEAKKKQTSETTNQKKKKKAQVKEAVQAVATGDKTTAELESEADTTTIKLDVQNYEKIEKIESILNSIKSEDYKISFDVDDLAQQAHDAGQNFHKGFLESIQVDRELKNNDKYQDLLKQAKEGAKKIGSAETKLNEAELAKAEIDDNITARKADIVSKSLKTYSKYFQSPGAARKDTLANTLSAIEAWAGSLDPEAVKKAFDENPVTFKDKTGLKKVKGKKAVEWVEQIQNQLKTRSGYDESYQEQQNNKMFDRWAELTQERDKAQKKVDRASKVRDKFEDEAKLVQAEIDQIQESARQRAQASPYRKLDTKDLNDIVDDSSIGSDLRNQLTGREIPISVTLAPSIEELKRQIQSLGEQHITITADVEASNNGDNIENNTRRTRESTTDEEQQPRRRNRSNNRGGGTRRRSLPVDEDGNVDYSRLSIGAQNKAFNNFIKNSGVDFEKGTIINLDRSASFVLRQFDNATGYLTRFRYEIDNIEEALGDTAIFANNRLNPSFIQNGYASLEREKTRYTPQDMQRVKEAILNQATSLLIDPSTIKMGEKGTLSFSQNTEEGSRKLSYSLKDIWSDRSGFISNWIDNYISEEYSKNRKKVESEVKSASPKDYLNKLAKTDDRINKMDIQESDSGSAIIDVTRWDEATARVRTFRIEVENLAHTVDQIKANGDVIPDFIADGGDRLAEFSQMKKLAEQQALLENEKRVYDKWVPEVDDNGKEVTNSTIDRLKTENTKALKQKREELDRMINQANDTDEILTDRQRKQIENIRKGYEELDDLTESDTPSKKMSEDLAKHREEFDTNYARVKETVREGSGYLNETGAYQSVISALDQVQTKFKETQKILESGLRLSDSTRANLEKDLQKLIDAPDKILAKAGKGAKKENNYGTIVGIAIEESERQQKQAIAEYIKKQGGTGIKVGGRANGAYTVNYRKGDRMLVDKFNILREMNSQGELESVMRQRNTGSSEYVSPTVRFAEGVQQKIKSLSEYIFSIDLIQRAWNEIKTGFSFVRSMDGDLATINMTMDTSAEKLQQLGTSAIETGQSLGANAESVMNAVKIYANANETTDSILEKAKPTVMLANASGADTSVAADQIQGVVQQFESMEGQERRIVNSYEKISAGLAIDFAQGINGMSEAIQNSGSVASEAGLQFETYAAMVGKVQEKTRQEGSPIGNTLKTTMARISRSQSADPDVTAEDRSKAAAAYKSIGIDLYDKNGQYQDLNKTLDELYAKWGDLSDAEQNYIAEQSGGTRGINVFRAVMDTYGDAKELAQSALDDTGFSDQVQSKWANSINGKAQELRASVEGVWNNILDSGTINLVMGMGQGVVDVLGGITGALKDTGEALLGSNSGWLTLLATLKLVNGVWNGADQLKTTGSLIEGAKGFGQGLFSGVGLLKNGLVNLGRAVGIGSDAYIVEKNPDYENKQIPAGNSFKSFMERGTLVRKGFWKDFLDKTSAGFDYGKESKNKEETSKRPSSKGINKLYDAFGILSGKVSQNMGSLLGIKDGLSPGVSSLIAGSGLAIGAAVAGAVGKVIYDKVTEPARLREQATTTSETYQTEMESIKKNRKTFKELYDEWEPLSRGVHPTNGENIGLSNEDYKHYQDLSTQIGNIVPEAVAAYDEYNNAILTQTAVLKAATEKFNSQSLAEAQKVTDAQEAFQKTFEQTTISKPNNQTKVELASGATTQESANLALSKLDKKKAIDVIMNKSVEEIQDSWNASGIFKDLDSRSKEYLETSFGLKGISKMSADNWEKKRVELKATSDQLGTEIEQDRNTFMTLLDAYLTQEKVRNDNRKEGKISSDLFDQLSAVLNKTTAEQVVENTQNGLTPEKYVQQWVDTFREQGEKLTPILKNLRSITPESSFEDIKSYFDYDLPTLSKAVGADQTELAKTLGLEEQQKMLDAYQTLIRSQAGFADKIKPLTGEALKQSPWDNLRTVDDQSGYFARYQATDNNRMAIVASPILPDGTVLDSDSLEKAMTDILNGTDIDTGLQYQLFNGKDANKEARKFAKEINKGARGIRDVTNDIDDFIARKGINTANDLEALKRLMERFGGQSDMWDKINKNWDLERYDPSAIAEKLKSLEQNLTSVSNALDTLDSAQQASSSSSGMMREQIEAVQDVFSSIDSFNYDSLFESTAEGVHMNIEELDRLNSEYRKFNLDKYKNEYQDILDQYEAKREYISKLGDSEQDQVEKKVQLRDMNDLRTQLQKANELQSMYEGLTNSVALYQRAIKLGEEGDTYDYLAKTGYEGAKKRYDMGEVGTREFKSFAQMLTNEDLGGKGVGAYLEAYESNIGKFHEIFTEDPRQGILATIQKLENAGMAVGDATNGWAINADLQEMADALGISDALATEVAKKLNDFGAQMKFAEETDYLKDLRKEAQKTFDAIDDSVKEGLEVKGTKSSLEEVDDQIQKIQQRQKELRESGNEEGAKQLDSLLDYTKQLKVELEVGLEVDNSEETIDSLKKHLSTLDKKYKIDIEVNWDNNDPDYYSNKLTELKEGLAEASGGKLIEVGSDLYKEAFPVAEQIIAREQASRRPELATMNVETIENGQIRQAVSGFQTIQAAVESYNRLNIMKKELNLDIPDADISASLENIHNSMANFEKENPSIIKALQKQFGQDLDFSNLSPTGFDMLMKDLEIGDFEIDANGNIQIKLSKETVRQIKNDSKSQVEEATKEGVESATPSGKNNSTVYEGDTQYSDKDFEEGKKKYTKEKTKESQTAQRNSKLYKGESERDAEYRLDLERKNLERRAQTSKEESARLDKELDLEKKKQITIAGQEESTRRKEAQQKENAERRGVSSGDDTRAGKKNSEEFTERLEASNKKSQNKNENNKKESKVLNDELSSSKKKKYNEQGEKATARDTDRANRKAKLTDDNIGSTSAQKLYTKNQDRSKMLRQLANADMLDEFRRHNPYEQWKGASDFMKDPTSLTMMDFKKRTGAVKYLAETNALDSLDIEDRKAYIDFAIGDIPNLDLEDKEVVVDYIANDREIKDLDFEDQEVMIKYWAETGELSDQVDDFTDEEKLLHIKTLMETGEVDNWTPDEKQAVVMAIMNSGEVDRWTPGDKQAFATYLLDSGAIDSWTPEMKQAFAQYLVDSGIVDGWTPEQKQAWAKYLVNSGVVDRYRPDDKQAYVNYLTGSTPNYDPPNLIRYVNYVATNGGEAQPAVQTSRPNVVRYRSFNGTAHALGTVASKAFNKVRSAFALGSGDWGAKQSGKSLVGELGPEIRVRGHRFDILGQDHAEIADVRRGDIIFNHKICGYKIH